MGSIYLAATILGLGILLLQVFFSGGDADAGDGLDIHGGLDGAGHVPALDGAGADALQVDHSADGLAHADGGHGGFLLGTVGLFLSLRMWTYGLTAFGLLGGLITWFGLAGVGVTLALAIVFGLVSGVSVSLLFRGITKPVSSTSSAADAIGVIAHVTVGMTKGSLGKIRLTLKGKRVDFLARTDADEIEVGQSVVVIGFAQDHAIVEPLRELDSVRSNTPENSPENS